MLMWCHVVPWRELVVIALRNVETRQGFAALYRIRSIRCRNRIAYWINVYSCGSGNDLHVYWCRYNLLVVGV